MIGPSLNWLKRGEQWLTSLGKGKPAQMSARTVPPNAIDVMQATQIAQSYAGAFKQVAHCAELPEGTVYLKTGQTASAAAMIFFAVLDVQPAGVGGADYIGVSKTTGAVLSFGRLGE